MLRWFNALKVLYFFVVFSKAGKISDIPIFPLKSPKVFSVPTKQISGGWAPPKMRTKPWRMLSNWWLIPWWMHAPCKPWVWKNHWWLCMSVGLTSAQVAHENDVLVGWLVGWLGVCWLVGWLGVCGLSLQLCHVCLFVSFLVCCFCSAKPAVDVKTSGVVLQDSPTHPYGNDSVVLA